MHAVICKLVNHSISSGCCQCHTSMIVGSNTVCYTCWHTSMPRCNLSIMLMFNFEMAMRFLNCKRIAEVEQDRKGKQILTFDLLFLWKAASALDVILWDHVHCQSYPYFRSWVGSDQIFCQSWSICTAKQYQVDLTCQGQEAWQMPSVHFFTGRREDIKPSHFVIRHILHMCWPYTRSTEWITWSLL